MVTRLIVRPGQPPVEREMSAVEAAAWRASIGGPGPADVRAEAARRLEAIARPYSAPERATWDEQVREAEALAADAGAAAPLLGAIADGKGVAAADLAREVLAKSAAFKTAAGAILAAQAALLASDPIPHDYAADHRWPEASA